MSSTKQLHVDFCAEIHVVKLVPFQACRLLISPLVDFTVNQGVPQAPWEKSKKILQMVFWSHSLKSTEACVIQRLQQFMANSLLASEDILLAFSSGSVVWNDTNQSTWPSQLDRDLIKWQSTLPATIDQHTKNSCGLAFVLYLIF